MTGLYGAMTSPRSGRCPQRPAVGRLEVGRQQPDQLPIRRLHHHAVVRPVGIPAI